MDRVFRFFENYADENEHRRESNATRIKKVLISVFLHFRTICPVS